MWSGPTKSNGPPCYVPKDKGGYGQIGSVQQVSETITRYTLARLSDSDQSKRFSMYDEDVEKLTVEASVSGTDMVRLTIRDADQPRYEVPVPVHWEPSLVPTSVSAKLQFELTRTSNEQAGFRVKRTDTQSNIFDTSYFAEGFVYSDQFVQLVTSIPSRNVYG